MSSVTNTTSPRVSQDSFGIDLDLSVDQNGGDGSLATINELIARMQKIGIAMRDLEREFTNQMLKSVGERQLLALNTKLEAIKQTFTASLVSAGAQILGGLANVAGAASGSTVATTASKGFESLSTGAGGIVSANINKASQETKLLGDFQDQTLDTMMKSLSKTIERATEASRQMLDVTRDLVSLHDRLAAAVKL